MKNLPRHGPSLLDLWPQQVVNLTPSHNNTTKPCTHLNLAVSSIDCAKVDSHPAYPSHLFLVSWS